MSQYNFEDIDPYVDTGINLASDLNSWRDAVESSHIGSTRPVYIKSGMFWINSSANPWIYNLFDGIDDIPVAHIDYVANTFTPVFRSGAEQEYINGVGFTAGTSNSVVIQGTYTNKNEFFVMFGGAFQTSLGYEYNYVTKTITFDEVIPYGVESIFVVPKGGSVTNNNPPTLSVGSIAELKTIDSANYYSVFVEGYYTKGDGGGGHYWYDSTDTTSLDNGGTVIVAADGARWKLIHNGEVSVKQFGAKGDDSYDDTSYLQTCISTALADNLSIRVPSGTYKVTSGLTKPSSIKCPNIRGDGCRTTAIKAYGFAADTSILTLAGVSGTASLVTINGITFYGDSATPNCVEINGQCGVIIKECEFGTAAIGILAHNKTSGQFTEYCVAENCVFRTSCVESLVYRRTGGDASFHGTGLRNCMINEAVGATSKKIRIGGTGSTSNAIIVYNAPMSFQIWKNATNPIIENNTTYYNTVLHGTITLELFSGALGSAWDICTGTNKTYFVGNISNGTGNMAKLGTLVPSESFETKSDGTVSVWRKPYRVPAALMASGANTLINFPAVNGESYQVRAVFTSNASPWKYVYLLEVYCSTTINTVTTLATLGSYYAGDNAQPAFSMSGSSLIATQAGWVSDRIYCEMSVVQTASCINFQL